MGCSRPRCTRTATRVQAEANDYVEKEFGAFYRSCPAQGGDALAYQRDGFLWNAAQKAGLSVADFGEYANFFNVPSSVDKWDDWYKDSQILEGKASGPLPIPVKKYQTYSDIPSLNSIIDPYYPKFDTNVPDQYRVDMWLKAWKKYQRSGHFPNLSFVWMPDDHTAGVGSGDPAPIAQVADNDLAVTGARHGLAQQMVEEHSCVRARGRPAERCRPRRRSPQRAVGGHPHLQGCVTTAMRSIVRTSSAARDSR